MGTQRVTTSQTRLENSSGEIEEGRNNVVFSEHIETKEEKCKKEINLTSQKHLFSKPREIKHGTSLQSKRISIFFSKKTRRGENHCLYMADFLFHSNETF